MHCLFGANRVLSCAGTPPTNGLQQKQRETRSVPQQDKGDKNDPYESKYGGKNQ